MITYTVEEELVCTERKLLETVLTSALPTLEAGAPTGDREHSLQRLESFRCHSPQLDTDLLLFPKLSFV